MGCGLSKKDDTGLVSLCKERKELIKAAVDCRYALAFAHTAYFQSLLDAGNAISHFVEEELVINIDPPANAGSDHQSLGEGSCLESSSLESDTDVISLTDYVHEGSELSEQSSPINESRSRVNSNVYHSKKSSEEVSTRVYEQPEDVSTTIWCHNSPKSFTSQPQHGNVGGLMNLPPNNVGFPQFENGASFSGSVYLPTNNLTFAEYGNVMSSGGLTNLLPDYLRFDWYGKAMSFGSPTDLPRTDPRFPHYRSGASYAFSMNLPPSDSYYNQAFSHPAAPPSPPPPEVSTWDYVNPFGLFDDTPGYYFQGGYETSFGSTTGPDLREVREREGIPDLVDDTEETPTEEASDKIDLGLNDRSSSVEGPSDAVPPKNVEEVHLAKENATERGHDGPISREKEETKGGNDIIEEDIKSNKDSFAAKGLEEEERKNSVTSEIQETSTQVGESSKLANSITLAHGSRDLQEALKDVRDAFKVAFNHGLEVSAMLEAGKLPYQHRDTIFKVLSSWILNFIAPPMVIPSPYRQMTPKLLASGIVKMVKIDNGILEKDISMNSGNLLSTLENLYEWEKKLYEEVKNEEILRVIYTKEWKKLKKLDSRGAESSKIDATHASIKMLLPKIKVAISKVEAISRRIHKLRDEELQHQLNELIHRLVGMWTLMVECHKKQFETMMEAKVHVQMADAGIPRSSSLKATQKLEMEVLNWGSSFSDWISIQKAFVKFLNGWLVKCLLQEPEETPDGTAPFSPSRLGAPSIFVICNDWCHAIEKVSEAGVSKAIHDFALMLHQLWEKLNEEKHQRLKAEYLSKYLEKRLKSLSEEGRMNLNQYASLNNAATSGGTTENGGPFVDRILENLNSIRERLNEEKAKHEEVIKQVNHAACHSFQQGLIPVFEALWSFSSEMLTAYKGIRITSEECRE